HDAVTNSGRTNFDQLMIDIDGVSPGLAELLKHGANGAELGRVDLVGVSFAHGGENEVYHLELDDAAVKGVAIDGDNTALSLGYSKFQETIKAQNPDGSLGDSKSVSVDLLADDLTLNPVDHDALVTMA